MPKWYRLNGSGSWAPTNSIYRLNGSGVWTKIKTIYRLNGSGSWGAVHSSQEAPSATTSPTLTNQVSSTTNFYGGDTLTLTRGAYTNTTANSDTTYRMTIYKGLNSSLSLNDTNWTPASRSTFTGANSTSSTSITYSLTDDDAKAGYYLVGEVRVNNDANTAGSATYDFETASKVLSRISFTVSALTVTPTYRGGTFSWTVGGVDASTFIYSQTLIVRLGGPSGDIKKTVSIVPGTTTTTITDSTNISPSTLYYAIIEVVANDGWKFTATPNKLSDDEYFNTLSAPPVNTVIPAITPLNNRGYLPVSTTLTSSTGTWTGVSGSTAYTYNWIREDVDTGAVIPSGFSSSNTQSYTLDHVGDFVYVIVKATNPDTSNSDASSNTYVLDQAVVVGNVTPTTATVNVATNFSFNISHYPTSYVVNWGDGTTDSENIAANTSTVNKTISHTYTSTGTKTVTITAQPGNKTSTTNITVSAPAPTASGFARSDSTATPSQPSTLSFSSSNNQVTTSWTNGSPITSVNFAASGAGVNTNYTDTSAPFITSDLSNYSSSGTYTATVTNFNNSLQVRASWNQSNSQSYQVNYSSSVFGSDQTAIINNSGSSVNHDIGWSSGSGSFTFQSVTLWSGTNGTGTSNTFTTGLTAITPSQKSSSRSGSTSLTYQLPNLITNPAYGSATSTSGGWTASITTQPNPTGGTYSVISQTVGSASVNSSTGALTASGLSAGQSSTVTVRYSRSGYNPVDITASGSALALTKLATPTNVNASDNRTDGVLVTWTAVSEAAYYGVWYGPPAPSYNSNPDFGGPSNPSLITGTSYLDDSLGSGVTRDYYVQAFRTNNPIDTKSEWSAGDSGTRVAGSSTGATQISYVAPTTNAINVTTGSGGTIPDDGFFTLNLPFNTFFNGTSYSQIHIGTNSYATFGGGSGAFSGLGASNPAFNKIMVDALDRGSTGIYYTSSASSWTMRYQGSSGTTGSPIAIIWELQCFSSNPKSIRLSIAQVAGGGTTGMFSSSSLINSLGGAGTSWNITSV